ncbi:hypothetical protein [Curtobacterium sp. L1-20]|uniref:hypothetical protein n=1 Tax=Curtobacterium sp. L1-20 TaxID=3138181 RepID=UPI003B527210
MRVPRRVAATLLAVLLVCGAVTIPWGLVTGSGLPFGVLSFVALVAVGYVMVRASKHPED